DITVPENTIDVLAAFVLGQMLDELVVDTDVGPATTNMTFWLDAAGRRGGPSVAVGEREGERQAEIGRRRVGRSESKRDATCVPSAGQSKWAGGQARERASSVESESVNGTAGLRRRRAKAHEHGRGERARRGREKMGGRPTCVHDGCVGVLFTDKLLASGNRRRVANSTYPIGSLKGWIQRVLSQHGMAELLQNWRTGPDDHEEMTEPIPADAWKAALDEDTLLGDIP
ncbi:hypothetical protein FRC10_009056, partial [Ceratobasidium sp. 414]